MRRRAVPDDVRPRSMLTDLVESKMVTPFTYRPTGIRLLQGVAVFTAAVHIALGIALMATGNYDLHAFTYWSYTMLIVFHVCLLVAVFYQRLAMTLTVLIGLPLNIGFVWIVCVGIIVLIYKNPDLFTDGTTCDPFATDPRSMGLINAGNWAIHGWPLFDATIILLTIEYFARYVLVQTLDGWSSFHVWLYFFYWQLCPFIPMVIFDAVFSFTRTYPSGLSWWALFGISFAAINVFQLFSWYLLTTRLDYKQAKLWWLQTSEEQRHKFALFVQRADPKTPADLGIGMELSPLAQQPAVDDVI